jgi:hypothetical protein
MEIMNKKSDEFIKSWYPLYTKISGYQVSDVGILVFCVILIVMYGNIIEKLGFNDNLANKFYDNCNDCDYWGVTHFLFYAALGLLFPNHHLRFLFLGSMWEIIEGKVGSVNYGDNSIVHLFGGWGKNKIKTTTNDWWYGRMGDIVFNMAGYTVASWIAS